MTSIVLIGLPNLIQALIYGTAAAAGGTDPDDNPFTFMNEEGRQTYIDFTPIFRHLPGYQGGDSGERRVYMRWGKQAYEVFDGWFKNPLDMTLRKSSSAFRTVFEQATGSTTAGWELPFKDQGVLGAVSIDGKFTGSRLHSITEKFLPITVESLLQGKPSGFIAPVAHGVTIGGVTYSMKTALEAYVNKDALPKYLRSADLSSIVAELVHSAEANGIDPKEAFKRAKGQVVGTHYLKFFRALNENNVSALEEEMEKLMLLGKGIDDFNANMERRFSSYDRIYTDELRDRVASAFRSTTE